MIERLVVASKNSDKVAEIERALVGTGLIGELVQGHDWPDVDETAASLEGNALLKARAVMEATGIPAMADDTGLEVIALGGEPGVFSARYAGPEATYDDNVTKLLAALDGAVDRRARFRTCIALAHPDGTHVTAEGCVDGVITDRRRGARGFGYDPVFEVDGMTFAEMTPEQKGAISHRARAIEAIAARIRADDPPSR